MRIVKILILIILATSRLNSDEIRDKFNCIYSDCEWGRDLNGEGTSGTGSTFESARLYISFVNNFIKTHDVKSILEIGCGDGVLLEYLNIPQETSYTGYDVVESILEKNRKKFPNYTFANKNILTENLPEVDLILCKDVLQHLPNNVVINIFDKIKTRCKWALLTNDFDLASNNDIPVGGHRYLDLKKKPFGFIGRYVFKYEWFPGRIKKVFLFTTKRIK